LPSTTFQASLKPHPHCQSFRLRSGAFCTDQWRIAAPLHGRRFVWETPYLRVGRRIFQVSQKYTHNRLKSHCLQHVLVVAKGVDIKHACTSCRWSLCARSRSRMWHGYCHTRLGPTMVLFGIQRFFGVLYHDLIEPFRTGLRHRVAVTSISRCLPSLAYPSTKKYSIWGISLLIVF